MTPPAPARLVGYFATAAAICVIARRGPSRYSQLILWRTDTDSFEPGQWTRGRVQYATLSSDGRYMTAAIMAAMPRENVVAADQISVICRPPYFTALEIWIGGLCVSGLGFLEDDTLAYPRGWPHRINAAGICPFDRIDNRELGGPMREHPHVIDASTKAAEGVDQKGRKIRFEGGKVFVIDGSESRQLFDVNLYQFEKVEPPDWATDW